MQDYKNIMVWQKAHELVKDSYALTADFPKHELFGMTSQLRRAAVSVPTNIVEGSGEQTQADFARFCSIAYGSATELEYFLLLSHELNYLDKPKHLEMAERTSAFIQIIMDLQIPIQGLQSKVLLGDNKVQEKILKKQERINELILKKQARLESLDLMTQIVMNCKSQPELYCIQNPVKTLKFELKSKGVQYFLPMAEWKQKIASYVSE